MGGNPRASNPRGKDSLHLHASHSSGKQRQPSNREKKKERVSMSYDSLHAVSTQTSRQKVLPKHKVNSGAYLLFAGLLIGLLAFSLSMMVHQPVTAQGGFPDPNAGCPHATCGEVSPLIPMQSAEAVHMGLVWKRNSATPKILFHARFPEYTPNDMADPALIDLAISSRSIFVLPACSSIHR